MLHDGVLWRGASRIDGAPVVVVVTGVSRASRNRKTGRMRQVWVMCADVHPMDALRSGEDYAVCGDCRHRGSGGRGRSCYVGMRTVSQVWKKFRAGGYADIPADRRTAYGCGAEIRLGAYGDSAAVPVDVLQAFVAKARSVVGYTHQWQRAQFDARLMRWCMASVDSPAELRVAWHAGYATFRVKRPEDVRVRGEAECPAPALTCDRCRLCDGLTARHRAKRGIVEDVHGRGAKFFDGSGA